MTAADYPYTSGNNTVANCAYVAGQGFVNTVYKSGYDGYYNEPENNTYDFQVYIEDNPLAAEVLASTYAFQTYSSGVLSGNCSYPYYGNAAITLVGYVNTNKG